MTNTFLQITPNEYLMIEKHIRKLLHMQIPFERIVVSKANLLKMFSHNKFKLDIINKQIVEHGTVYRCGSLIDLCTGPHIKHTGKIKKFKILNVSLRVDSDIQNKTQNK